MSLAQSVLEVVKDMEKEAGCIGDTDNGKEAKILYKYSKMLKLIVGVVFPEQSNSYNLSSTFVGSNVDKLPCNYRTKEDKLSQLHEKLVERAQEIDRAKSKVEQIQTGGVGMVLMVGGISDGTYAPFDINAPIGARSLVAGEAYVWDGKELKYDREATEKYAESRRKDT